MFRPTLLGSILAVVMAPMSVGLNSFMQPIPKDDTRLAESLTSLGATLASFEHRQAGSEAELTKQLAMLATLVADTEKASQQQIRILGESLAQVRSVAMQAADKSEFTSLLEDFGKKFESKVESQISTLIKAEVEEALPQEGVGTLDVESKPSTGDSELDSIQTMGDAARRIIALEKEVAALKARSTVSSTPAPSAFYYESYPSSSYSVVSGGSTGSVASGSSTGSYRYSQPVQQMYYSQPVQRTYSSPTYYYSAPATSQRRTEYATGVRSAFGQCRIVNGVRICN